MQHKEKYTVKRNQAEEQQRGGRTAIRHRTSQKQARILQRGRKGVENVLWILIVGAIKKEASKMFRVASA